MVSVEHLKANGHFFNLSVVRGSWMFVDFFFVLSGFVISHSYGNRIATRSDVGSFMLRRFLRLWPLHAAMLMLLIGVEYVKSLLLSHSGMNSAGGAFTGSRSLNAIVPNLTLTQGLGYMHQTTWNDPSWSISAEFYTYFIFAVVSMALAKKSTISYLIISLAAGIAVFFLSPAYMATTVEAGFFRCICGFFLGCAIHGLPRPAIGYRFACLLEGLVIALALMLVSFAGLSIWTMTAPLVFALAVWVFSLEQGIFSTAFRGMIAQKLGELSYSIYMTHFVILTILYGAYRVLAGRLSWPQLAEIPVPGGDPYFAIVLAPWKSDVICVFYLVTVLAFSLMTFHFIEQPGRRLFKPIWNKLSKRSGSAG